MTIEAKQENSFWIAAAILAAVFVIAYVVRSYIALADRRVAYLYHPESDEIYILSLAPTVSPYGKWDPFVPFTPLSFSEVDEADYLGHLTILLEQEQADRKLMETDFESWLDQSFGDSVRRTEEIENGTWLAASRFVEFAALENVEPLSILPSSVQEIVNRYGYEDRDIRAVDAVVLKPVWATDKNSRTSRPSIVILRSSVLITGMPTYAFDEDGIF